MLKVSSKLAGWRPREPHKVPHDDIRADRTGEGTPKVFPEKTLFFEVATRSGMGPTRTACQVAL